MLGAVLCFTFWVTLGWPLALAVVLALAACALWGVVVAQMDADAELDATLRRKTRVALDHAILHLDCAANGIDDASELYEDAVTRPLDDAAVMHGDGGIDQIASQRSEAGKCPLLVGRRG